MKNDLPKKRRGFLELVAVNWQGLVALAGAFIAGISAVVIIGDISAQPEQIQENLEAIEQEAEIRRQADQEILSAIRALIYNQRQIINNQTRQLCRIEGRSVEECDRIKPLPIPSPEINLEGIQ